MLYIGNIFDMMLLIFFRIRNHTEIPKTKSFRSTIPGVGTQDVIVTSNGGHFEVTIDGQTLNISDNFSVSQSLLSPEVDGKPTHLQVQGIVIHCKVYLRIH